jgi:sulfide:quinone oxidoreductase
MSALHRSPGEKGAITDRFLERGIILDDGYDPAEFLDGGIIDKDGAFRKVDFVSGLLWEQVDLTRKMGGWESVEMVRRYAHLAPEHLAGDSANIEDALSSIGTDLSQPPFLIAQKKG